MVGDAHGDPHASPVLLLHGAGQTRRSWGSTAATLAADGFYAVTADLRGHGESEWASDGDYSWRTRLDDLVRWSELLGIPAMVGASMGGALAMSVEGDRAERGLDPIARSIVMVDIAHRIELDGVERIRAFMLERPDGFADLDEAADSVARYLPHRPRPRDTSGLAHNLRLGGDGRYRWHWDPAILDPKYAFDDDDQRRRSDEAARLRVPVLLVRGRSSDVVSEQTVREFLDLVPQAEHVDVAGAHHMVAGDVNDAFAGAVVDFLRRHR